MPGLPGAFVQESVQVEQALGEGILIVRVFVDDLVSVVANSLILDRGLRRAGGKHQSQRAKADDPLDRAFLR
jgi:hypothetical protein